MARTAAAALLLLLLACAGAAHAQLLGSRLLCVGRTPASVVGLKAIPGNGQFALAWQPTLCAATYRVTAQRTDVQNVRGWDGRGAGGLKSSWCWSLRLVRACGMPGSQFQHLPSAYGSSSLAAPLLSTSCHPTISACLPSAPHPHPPADQHPAL